jgi:hypothetical protein
LKTDRRSRQKARCLRLIVFSALLVLLSACSEKISINLSQIATLVVYDFRAKVEESIQIQVGFVPF